MKVGARYYDPQVGSFTTRDTYLDQKPYLYCEHDPVNGVDPSGHWTASGTLGIVGGLFFIGVWLDVGISIDGNGQWGITFHEGGGLGFGGGISAGPGAGFGTGNLSGGPSVDGTIVAFLGYGVGGNGSISHGSGGTSGGGGHLGPTYGGGLYTGGTIGWTWIGPGSWINLVKWVASAF